MRKFCLASFCLLALVFCLTVEPDKSSAVSPHIVISQFQTGGGGAGTFNDEFVEIFNRGADPVDLNGYRIGRCGRTFRDMVDDDRNPARRLLPDRIDIV